MNDEKVDIDHDFFSSGSDNDKKQQRKNVKMQSIRKPSEHGDGYSTSTSSSSVSSNEDNDAGNSPDKEKTKETITVHIPDSSKGKSHVDYHDSSSSVTDVSPLSSPNRTPRVVHNKKIIHSKNRTSGSKKHLNKTEAPIKYYSSSEESTESENEKRIPQKNENSRKKQKEALRRRNDIAAYNHRRRMLDVAAQNSMDLSQLLEVIININEEKSRNYDEPLEGFSPISGQTRRKNLSFTNDQVYNIDRENQRLLRELARMERKQTVRPSSAASSRSTMSTMSKSSMRSGSNVHRRPQTAQPRLHHAGRNRIREQQRIEQENLALLKRLQSAKSDKSMQRKNLLRDYKKQTNYMTNPLSRQPTGSRASRSYNRHLQTHGFSPSKPEWQN